MGLFSSVIHVRGANQEAVCKALIDVLPKWNFRFSEEQPVSRILQPGTGEDVRYLVSPLLGSWSTIIQDRFAGSAVPCLTELAERLSAALGTYTLALMVHDDDVLYYNLCGNGADLDGYNSNPQYFETSRLSEDSIAEQRHGPLAFAPLLPDRVSLIQLENILDRGWWSAWKNGRLDADGIEQEDEQQFVSEEERMIAIGNLLQLHGESDGYPFASYADDSSIVWKQFRDLRFRQDHPQS